MSIEALDILIGCGVSLIIGFILLVVLSPWYIRRLERKERELLNDPLYIADQVALGVKMSKQARENDQQVSSRTAPHRRFQ